MKQKEHSIIDPNTKLFKTNFYSIEALLRYRKANLKVTRMVWLKQRPVIDAFGELSVPSTPIIIHLN